MQPNAIPPKKTATGLDENLAGLLCYEPDNKFIRFHAIQSIIAFGFITIVTWVLGWVPVVGPFLSTIIGLGGVALWVATMFKAYQGARYKLPWVGDVAERYSGGKTS